MTASVDVLAVLADAATWVGPNEDALREARAAVAELIEADRAFDKASRAFDDARFSDWEGLSDESRLRIAEAFEVAAVRRAAALARVGAAQPLTEAQQAQEANLRG